jgi:hypothetical protein
MKGFPTAVRKAGEFIVGIYVVLHLAGGVLP